MGRKFQEKVHVPGNVGENYTRRKKDKMQVKEFKVIKEINGVVVYICIKTEAEIKVDIPVHREIVQGKSLEDTYKLEGKKPFNEIEIQTVSLQSVNEAKKAVQEIWSIMNNIVFQEEIILKRLKEIESYLKHEFEKYIPTDEETVFLG